MGRSLSQSLAPEDLISYYNFRVQSESKISSRRPNSNHLSEVKLIGLTLAMQLHGQQITRLSDHKHQHDNTIMLLISV